MEITKENEPSNDAVIGVKANKSCGDLSDEMKNYLKVDAELKITIYANDTKDVVITRGSPILELTDEKNIVIQKSDFIDRETLAIFADKSAFDLNKELVKKLKNPNTKIEIKLEIK